MKVICKIARAELCKLFSSPVAWLILIVLAVQFGISFCDVLILPVKAQMKGKIWDKMTLEVFYGRFSYLLHYLYFYIPLLTMGLMSREYNSGSVKLLYSSPVTNRQIVLGKYLSMMIFGLLMIGVLLPYVAFAACTIENIDWLYLLCNFLGMYLLICTYAAIGLFISSLTSNQIVSAIGTLAAFSCLSLVGNIGQDIPVVRDITYWLALSSKTGEFINGLFCSEYAIYFLTVIALFLTLTLWHLQRKRGCRGNWGIKYTGLFIAVFSIGYAASRPQLTFYRDMTRNQQNTVSPVTQEWLKRVDGDLKLVTYVNILGPHAMFGLPGFYKSDFERFRKYIRFKPNLKMEYIYYYDGAPNPESGETLRDKAEKYCRAKHLNFDRILSPEEMYKQIDLSKEEGRLVRQLVWKDSVRTFLRMFDDNQVYPRQREMVVALKSLAEKPVETVFLSGHGERDIYNKGDAGYYRVVASPGIRESLVNQGYQVQQPENAANGIPETTELLVIADPQTAFSEQESAGLKKYIETGKNLLILGEPGKEEILNPLLENIGVQLTGKLIQQAEEERPELVTAGFTGDIARLGPSAGTLYRSGWAAILPGCSGLSVGDKGFDAWAIVRTDPGTTRQAGGNGSDSLGSPVVVALQRTVGNRQQRIVVCGDADWLNNGEYAHPHAGVANGNATLRQNLFRWLIYDKYPVPITAYNSTDNYISLRRRDIFWVKTGALGAYPLLLLTIFGIYRNRRKKNK